MATNKTRLVKETELILIRFLLYKAGVKMEDFPISKTAFEYEGGKMGSINLVYENEGEYDSDIIQAQYIDTDNVIVMITLTKDKNNQLLDLDFWKVSFEKLETYPTPEDLVFENFKEIR